MLKIANDNSQEELTCYPVNENVQRVFFKLHVFIFLLSPFFLKGEIGMPSVTLNRSLMRSVAVYKNVQTEESSQTMDLGNGGENVLPSQTLRYSAGHQSAAKM